MTIIVTGGAGFIGSNFIYFQLKHHPEDRIVCLDKPDLRRATWRRWTPAMKA